MTLCAVLGVDPGVRGGLALLRADGSVAGLWTMNPALTESEAVEKVRQAAWSLQAYRGVCFFEKVGFKRGDGGKGAWTFGAITKLVTGALLALDVTPHYVYPMAWQAEMGCLTGGNKNVSKRRAVELFPAEKITHARADALLIAEYGRRRLGL